MYSVMLSGSDTVSAGICRLYCTVVSSDGNLAGWTVRGGLQGGRQRRHGIGQDVVQQRVSAWSSRDRVSAGRARALARLASEIPHSRVESRLFSFQKSPRPTDVSPSHGLNPKLPGSPRRDFNAGSYSTHQTL